MIFLTKGQALVLVFWGNILVRNNLFQAAYIYQSNQPLRLKYHDSAAAIAAIRIITIMNP